ncbi:MAG: response regulator, partial [Anaerolineae bacterium]|nr:response regulator [Anaerolineae bacterium]
LDVMMPGMDGIELCRVIRTRETTTDTPVLILSARGDAESVMRGMEAGANDYLPKPILHHDLVSKVRAILEGVPS